MNEKLLKVGIIMIVFGIITVRIDGNIFEFSSGFLISLGLVFIFKNILEMNRGKCNEK